MDVFENLEVRQAAVFHVGIDEIHTLAQGVGIVSAASR